MEEWKKIDNFPNYEISNFGNVRNIKRNKEISAIYDKNGYKKVHLFNNGKDKMLFVHRLVAKAFIPNPENKPTVNHIDGNTSNSNINNLEWATFSEQQLHSIYVLGNKNIITDKCRIAGINKRKRPVKREDGTIYESIVEASLNNNVSETNIRKCCIGERERAAGYRWEYVL